MALFQATVSSKGQVTIPKEIRERTGLTEGSRVQWIMSPNGQIRIIPKVKHILEAAGMLRRDGQKPITLEEMQAGIIAGAVHGGLGDQENSA